MKEVIDMAMWNFKSCPRCQGDMFLDRDQDSWYEECLQCSYHLHRVAAAPALLLPLLEGDGGAPLLTRLAA